MHLPIRLWKSGKATDIRIHHTRQNQEFTISDQTFDRLEFDPNSWLIAKVDQIMATSPEMIVPEIRIIHNLQHRKIRILISELKGNETVQLFESGGKLVMTQKLNSTESLLDAASLPSGIYLVKVKSGKAQRTEKYIIH
jgi:hypothetical protein